MIKAYFKNLFEKFKNCSLVSKILICFFSAVYLFFLIISVVPSNYVILTPGAINNTIYSVTVETENSRGYICTVGVYEYTRPSILQSWIAKNENEMQISDYNPKEDLSDKDDTQYGVISKKVSINNALITAYNKAKETNPDINLEYYYDGVIVSAIYPSAKTDLKPDDIIIKVNGASFDNFEKFRSLCFDNKKENDNLKFTVKRSNGEVYNEVEVGSTIYKTLNSKNEEVLTLGISAEDYFIIDAESENTFPKFKIVDTYASIGSSGGSLLALSIYNGLTSEDITKITVNGKEKQLLITGTGTIDANGNIGSISGAKQKVLTAYLNKANVFFVDDKDYEEACSALEEYNISEDAIKIICVSTFDDMLNALKEMGD